MHSSSACRRETSVSHGRRDLVAGARPTLSARAVASSSTIRCAPSPSRRTRNGRPARSASMRSRSSAGDAAWACERARRPSARRHMRPVSATWWRYGHTRGGQVCTRGPGSGPRSGGQAEITMLHHRPAVRLHPTACAPTTQLVDARPQRGRPRLRRHRHDRYEPRARSPSPASCSAARTTTPRRSSRTPSSAPCGALRADDREMALQRRGCTRSSATAPRPLRRPSRTTDLEPHDAGPARRVRRPARPPWSAARSSAPSSAACSALPERQRTALVMHELEGRSHAEIAAGLGVSVGATKALVSRARSGLAHLREAADRGADRAPGLGRRRGVRSAGAARASTSSATARCRLGDGHAPATRASCRAPRRCVGRRDGQPRGDPRLQGLPRSRRRQQAGDPRRLPGPRRVRRRHAPAVNGVLVGVDAAALDAFDAPRAQLRAHRASRSAWSARRGRVWAYTGSAAGRARLAAGLRAGTAVVSRAYLDGIEQGLRARWGRRPGRALRAARRQRPPVPVAAELRRARRCRLAHERGDELAGLVGLGVPLDAEHEAPARAARSPRAARRAPPSR